MNWKKETNWFTQSLRGSQKLRVPVGESEQDLKTRVHFYCSIEANHHQIVTEVMLTREKTVWFSLMTRF